MSDQRYYGKYRGTVINNVDPEQTGKILVQVSDSHGLSTSSWASPCFPIGGIQSASGRCRRWARRCGWSSSRGHRLPDLDRRVVRPAGQVPALALAGLPGSPSIVLQTPAQNTLMISDLPGPTGGILLKSATGALISISTVGIVISNGQGATIALTGSITTVNNGALVVT